MNETPLHMPGESALLQDSRVLYRIAAFQYNETLDNLMVREVFCCRPDDTIREIARNMANRKISSVVVTDENHRLLGIVTERDMVRKIVATGKATDADRKISDIMTPDPVHLSPSDSLFDSLSTFSRHTIKHLPIVDHNEVVGIITLRKIMRIRYAEPFVIIGQLDQARSVADYHKIRQNIVHLVHEKLEANIDPVDIVTMISLVNFEIHRRLLRQVLEEYGQVPSVAYSFFLTGSHGRKENLLFPDQDFCIILEDFDDTHHAEFDRHFHEISNRFSVRLNDAGFPFCKGNVMGQNPTWRKRISEWNAHVTQVFRRQDEHTVRYVTLFFDSAPLYGSEDLFSSYMDHAYTVLSRNHNVLRQIHEEEEGRHKVPLGLFGTFITERSGSHRKHIDMKRSGLIFIIESARILAMRHGIRETSTLRRLKGLVAKGVIHHDDSEYFENAYRVILHHTLKAQTDNFLRDGSGDYFLNPYDLSERNQEILKQAFKAVGKLQDIVGSEFGEPIL